MSQLTIGDRAQSLILSRRNETLKDSIQSLSHESVTGLIRDTTERVKGDFVPLAGIEATLTQLDAYRSVTAETGMIANHMQLALTSIADSAATLGSSLLAAASSNSPSRINTLGLDAIQRLNGAMAALNARMGDRSLFAGVATDSSAVAPPETMMIALDAAVAGAISSADVEDAVNAWFTDPAGFEAVVYQGGTPLGPVPIGPDQQAQLDVTAVDPAIVSMIKGLAMASLLQRGVLAGSDVARADLAKRAGESLASSQTAFAELGARLGTTEAGIVNAGVQNDAQKAALETARLGLLSVDPYETAAKLQEAQTQLETLFAITARMSRLSLVNFL
jgi:flagellar hook-associated protein 3 FlgL